MNSYKFYYHLIITAYVTTILLITNSLTIKDDK